MDTLVISIIGAGCFGLVIGWMTCRVHHDAKVTDIPWLASMIGTVGGGAVTALFDNASAMFGAYCIGLAVGFFLRPAFLRLGSLLGLPSAGSAPTRDSAERSPAPGRSGQ